MNLYLGVVFLSLIALSLSASLPPFIKACKRNDPKLTECAVKNGRLALKNGLVNGYPKLGVPVLDPFHIEELVIDGKGIGLKFTFKDIMVKGLKNLVLSDNCKFDLKKKHIELRAHIPKIVLAGGYTASGKVLVLPIEGKGDTNITLDKLDIEYMTEFELQKGKNKQEFLQLKNPKLTFKTEKFGITLTNLFNGDKNLGKQMNIFLNENWQEVLKEFGPAIEETFGHLITLIVNGIAQKVPYDEIFPK